MNYTMLSFLVVTCSLITFVSSCSIALPPGGQYYISNVQLLSTTDHSDEVLLTIARTTDQSGSIFGSSSRLTFENDGPWCKIMNVNTGQVGDVVTCADYDASIRSYSTPDTDSKTSSVSCQDNCDGSTATCTIVRDSYTYKIDNIAYSESDATCNATSGTPTIGGIAVSFTMEDTSTTYLSFLTNMVGVKFNDNTNTYTLYDVNRVGDWDYLKGGGLSGDNKPSIYSDINVIAASVPCCLCSGYALSIYNITTNTATMTSIGSDTKIDGVKQRGFYWASGYYSQSVIIYDLTTGDSTTFEPDLCDIIVQCLVAPCSTSSCPYNTNARCVDDYCGGCNARWFCGTQQITNLCDSTPVSNAVCPTTEEPTTTTTEPETTGTKTAETKTTETKTTETMTTTSNTESTFTPISKGNEYQTLIGIGFVMVIFSWI